MRADIDDAVYPSTASPTLPEEPMSTAARVVTVAAGSPAARSGVAVGDEIVAVNGEQVRDVIRYQLLTDEATVELELNRGGIEQTCTVDKSAGEPLGLELDSAVFDRVRTCDNHCPFCFIYQLPKGMRRSLYLKDDDYRLSFLYGNFTTLTRFTEADLERVVAERLGPLYVSIHATDPDVRTKLLRNRRGATSLRWLGALLDAGIVVHGQVVVCPGINDGEVLDDTLLGILDRFADLATVGVVPLGVSTYTNEPDMRAHTPAEAGAVIDTVTRWQERFDAACGRRTIFAADEYYLLAQRDFPDYDAYDDFAQHENGIGMVRTFEREVADALAGRAGATTGTRSGFFAWVDGVRPDGYRVPPDTETETETGTDAGTEIGAVSVALGPRPDPAVRESAVTIITGEYGASALAPLTGALSTHAGVSVTIRPVANRFFGGNIAVTGLLTGTDVADALDQVPPGDRVLLPDVVISAGRFLDDLTPEDLPRPVEIVGTDGGSLVAALGAIPR